MYITLMQFAELSYVNVRRVEKKCIQYSQYWGKASDVCHRFLSEFQSSKTNPPGNYFKMFAYYRNSAKET